jgi:hypothetical protein
VLGILLAGCSLREPRVSNASACSTTSQCTSTRVCFLGECRPPAANLSVVRVEVRPPGGSPLGVHKLQVDLRLSVVNDFLLQGLLSAKGTVTQDGSGVDGGTIVFTEHAPAVIPDRLEQVVAVTDPSGVYQALLAQGTWDMLVVPPAPVPPFRGGPLDTALSPGFDVQLPARATLASFDGGLTVDLDGGAIAGASVTAIDPSGAPVSAPAVSDSDGGYSLLLPPGLPDFALEIGPSISADGGMAQAAPFDPFPIYQPRGYSPVISLPLPPPAMLTVSAVDSTGSIVGSTIYIRSLMPGWTLARALTTGTDPGSIELREGDYQVQAAPPADATSPAVSPVHTITLPSSAPLQLTCLPKLRRSGTIVGPDGRVAGANFQILATRVANDLVPTRTITTSTDLNGNFRFAADPGSWRLDIVPPADTRLPRTIVSVTLSPGDPQDSALDPIRIAQPLPVGGVVSGRISPGAANTLVSNAMVSFFALDASGRSVFLGGGRTDPAGHYDVVLPDVATSSVSP